MVKKGAAVEINVTTKVKIVKMNIASIDEEKFEMKNTNANDSHSQENPLNRSHLVDKILSEYNTL